LQFQIYDILVDFQIRFVEKNRLKLKKYADFKHERSCANVGSGNNKKAMDSSD
jgi:hypothetical protein